MYNPRRLPTTVPFSEARTGLPKSDPLPHRDEQVRRLWIADDVSSSKLRSPVKNQRIASSRSTSRCGSNKPAPLRCGTYQPTALRWPFLLAEMVLLLAALAAVIALQRAMPDSDSTAVVDGQQIARRAPDTAKAAPTSAAGGRYHRERPGDGESFG